MREGTSYKCKAAGHLTNTDRALLPRYSRAWGTLRTIYSPSSTLSRQKLPPPRRRSVPSSRRCSLAKSMTPPFRKASQGTPCMILDARELAARRRENVVKKKRARPKVRVQIRRGRKVAANTVGSTIVVFARSIMPNTWR